MRLTAIVLFGLTALVFAASAAMNLRTALRGEVPAALQRLRISAAMLRLTGTLELAACTGLLAGLVILPLGIAAAGGLVLLMLAALGYHLRAGDTRGALLGPCGPLLLSAAALTAAILALP
jgi:hypothetical protein